MVKESGVRELNRRCRLTETLMCKGSDMSFGITKPKVKRIVCCSAAEYYVYCILPGLRLGRVDLGSSAHLFLVGCFHLDFEFHIHGMDIWKICDKRTVWVPSGLTKITFLQSTIRICTRHKSLERKKKTGELNM